MKLKKEDYKKTTYNDGSVSYDYTCKGNTYYIRVVGYGVDRTMFVYKNDEYETNLQNVFSTKDNLLAWNEFERLVNECSEKPQSSGGFKKNPQANPFALPLLAIYFDTNINKWDIKFFVQVDVGQTNTPSTQVTLLDFTLESNQFTIPTSIGITNVDWSGFDVPDIFKCEIMLKKFDKVEFEENPSADVFLFIPKSIIPPEQGDDGKPTDEPPQGGDDGKPTDEPPQGGDDGKPTDEPPQGLDKKPKPSDEDGKPTDEDDEYTYRKTKEEKEKPIPSDLLQSLADSVGKERNIVQTFFSRVKQGEIFLLSENFEKIKKDLNLPQSTTPRQLAESINQQLQ
jgi:hypothetical protein